MTINYQKLESWDDEFIFVELSVQVVLYDLNQEKQGGYVADLNIDNFENEFYHVVDNARLNDTDFLSSCLYTNTNDTQMHLTMKLISAIINYKNKTTLNNYIDLLVFTYTNNDHFTLLNNWNYPNYFKATFLIISSGNYI